MVMRTAGNVAANSIDSRSTIPREPSGSLEHVSVARYVTAKTIASITKSCHKNRGITLFGYLSHGNSCYFVLNMPTLPRSS